LVLLIATTGHRWNISYCIGVDKITADSFIIEMIRRYSNNMIISRICRRTSNQTGCNIN